MTISKSKLHTISSLRNVLKPGDILVLPPSKEKPHVVICLTVTEINETGVTAEFEADGFFSHPILWGSKGKYAHISKENFLSSLT